MVRKILFCICVISIIASFSIYAGEVKLTTYYPAPYGEYKKITAKKLEVNSDTNETPVTIKAHSTQSSANPLLKFLKSDGTELSRIHSDNQYNLYVGTQAGKSHTTGSFDTFVGAEAGRDTTTGGMNLAVGTAALRFNTTGSEATAIGPFAMENNTTGRYNTAVGQAALNVNTVAYGNTAVGVCTLNHTTGEYNTGLGAYTGMYLTSGAYNTFIGAVAGYSVGSLGGAVNPITGNNNTFLGYYAGTNTNQKGDAVNSMALGANTYTTADNQVVIGNDSITQTLLRGKVGIGTTTPVGPLDVRGGTAAASTNGTSINLYAQNGGTGNTNGGNIILIPGTASGTGTAGNVGIGTTAPGNLLEVRKDAAAATNGMTLNNQQGTGWGSSITFRSNYSSAYDAARIVGGGTTSQGNGILQFLTADGSALQTRMTIDKEGDVGIGTANPAKPLDVAGGVAFQGNHLYLVNPSAPADKRYWAMVVDTADGRFTLGEPRQLGGGWIDEDRRIFVIFPGAPTGSIQIKSNGKVVMPYGHAASDYVFEPDYKLMPIDDLAKYIKKNSCLPGMALVEGNDVAMNDILNKHMEKIEELTLYIIKQNEQIKALEKKVEQLTKK